MEMIYREVERKKNSVNVGDIPRLTFLGHVWIPFRLTANRDTNNVIAGLFSTIGNPSFLSQLFLFYYYNY